LFLVVQGIVVRDQSALREQMSLPPQNCPDCGPDPPEPTPAPKPWTTSAPDFQIHLNLLICLDSNVTGLIVTTIKKSLSTADVVFAPCSSGVQKIGIWRSAPKFPDNANARVNGVKAINILGSGETFAMFATASGYQKGVDAAWNAMSHRFNDNFEPSSSGDITLDSTSLSFSTTNKITLKVYGSAPAGITFTVTSQDSLSIDSGKHIACANTNSLAISKPLVDAATVLSFFFAPFLSPWLLDVEQKFANAQSSSLPIPNSVKCVLASMIPSVIPVCCTALLKGKKLDFQYSRLSVGSFGVKVGGAIVIAPRVPKAHIFVNCIPDENSTDISYRISGSTEDLLPPVSRVWKKNGVKISLPTKFTWKLNTVNTIELTATDVDSLVGHAQVSITAKYCPTPKGSGPSDTVCSHKPWTPGCDGGP